MNFIELTRDDGMRLLINVLKITHIYRFPDDSIMINLETDEYFEVREKYPEVISKLRHGGDTNESN